MSDDNRFFRLVWRFNALLILLVLIGAVIGGVSLYWQNYEVSRMAQLVDSAKVSASTYTLDPLSQNDLLGMAAPSERLLMLNQSRDAPGGGKSEPIARNILIVNETTKSSRWLFQPGSRAILAEDVLVNFTTPQNRSEREGTMAVVLGVAMVVAETDSNKDGAIDAGDRQTLYVYRMDGKPPVKILTADRIMAEPWSWMQKEFRLVYQDKAQSFAVVYSVPAFTVVSKIAVSDLPNLSKPQPFVRKIGFITEPRNLD